MALSAGLLRESSPPPFDGQKRRQHRLTAEQDFGPARVLVDLLTGDVRVMEFGEVDASDRDAATVWVLSQLRAVNLAPKDPLQMRDVLWG